MDAMLRALSPRRRLLVVAVALVVVATAGLAVALRLAGPRERDAETAPAVTPVVLVPGCARAATRPARVTWCCSAAPTTAPSWRRSPARSTRRCASRPAPTWRPARAFWRA